MTSLKSSTSLRPVARSPLLALLPALSACEGAREKAKAREEAQRNPLVTISGEEAVVVPAWQPPSVAIIPGEEAKVLAEAKKALEEDRLFGGPRDAVPLLLELRARLPDDADIARTHARAVQQLVVEGGARSTAWTWIPTACAARTNSAKSRAPRRATIRRCARCFRASTAPTSRSSSTSSANANSPPAAWAARRKARARWRISARRSAIAPAMRARRRASRRSRAR
jgi:hypothetical protein